MEISRMIGDHADRPLPHQLLMSWLKGYKRPNDNFRTESARHLRTITSYVSVETALSYYGLIPERVYEISSMTTKASRSFNTVLGVFTYTRLPLPYYSFGLKMLRLPSNQYAIVASPEKALCDKIVTTQGLRLRSIRSAYDYLVKNMRIDESSLNDLDTDMIKGWLPDSPKKESLSMMVKMIERL